MPTDQPDAALPLTTQEQDDEQTRLKAAGLEPSSDRDWALCLSGGGYRAMLFHLGSIVRLNELGYLKRLDRISSVSGGSITAGVLGAAWSRLTWQGDTASNLDQLFVRPLRRLADRTIDIRSSLRGLVTPGTIAQKIAGAYRRHLFQDKTLQDLPDHPRFVINATNLGTGVLWRFSKPYMGDWRIGRIEHPTLSLGDAVAASSAFPPFLSPLRLELDPASFTLREDIDLDDDDLRRQVFLSDGGVYDNLGLETALRYKNLLVSDGGGQYGVEKRPPRNWPFQLLRVTSTIDRQVRALRRRQLMAAYKAPTGSDAHRGGAFWSIRSDIANYGLADALRADHDATLVLASTKTALRSTPAAKQERLINWGYALADAAVRCHVTDAGPPPQFPYAGGVG